MILFPVFVISFRPFVYHLECDYCNLCAYLSHYSSSCLRSTRLFEKRDTQKIVWSMLNASIFYLIFRVRIVTPSYLHLDAHMCGRQELNVDTFFESNEFECETCVCSSHIITTSTSTRTHTHHTAYYIKTGRSYSRCCLWKNMYWLSCWRVVHRALCVIIKYVLRRIRMHSTFEQCASSLAFCIKIIGARIKYWSCIDLRMTELAKEKQKLKNVCVCLRVCVLERWHQLLIWHSINSLQNSRNKTTKKQWRERAKREKGILLQWVANAHVCGLFPIVHWPMALNAHTHTRTGCTRRSFWLNGLSANFVSIFSYS